MRLLETWLLFPILWPYLEQQLQSHIHVSTWFTLYPEKRKSRHCKLTIHSFTNSLAWSPEADLCFLNSSLIKVLPTACMLEGSFWCNLINFLYKDKTLRRPWVAIQTAELHRELFDLMRSIVEHKIKHTINSLCSPLLLYNGIDTNEAATL